jgi:YHS domain-containing protein
MDIPPLMITFGRNGGDAMSRGPESLDDGRVSFGDRDELELASAVDPVCGREVRRADAAGAIDHHGTVYFFCSLDCKAAFQADPARYALSSTAQLP